MESVNDLIHIILQYTIQYTEGCGVNARSMELARFSRFLLRFQDFNGDFTSVHNTHTKKVQ